MRKAREVKHKATVVFRGACFTLHKWHSNAPQLEADQSSAEDTEEVTYAKQQLGAPRGTMSRILGFSWNKERDTVSVEVPTEQAKLTKRGIPAKLDEPTEESQTEAKLVRKVLAVALDEEDEVEGVLRKFHLRKPVRVCAWMRRFAHNALRSRGKTRIEGPLTTQETNQLT